MVILLSSLPPVSAARALSLAQPHSDSQTLAKDDLAHLARSTVKIVVKVPLDYVWDTLVDFPSYPKIFKRVKSVTVTSHEQQIVYIETRLKPEMFVKNEIQHTVNDLSCKPTLLKWRLLDGNFKQIIGEWSIKPLDHTSCQLTYTLAVDPGPFIPPQLVSFLIHLVQNEIVDSFKRYVESDYLKQPKKSV